jgi:hypothetical protein
LPLAGPASRRLNWNLGAVGSPKMSVAPLRRRDRTHGPSCGPERDLAEVILELAAPLLERLGPAPSIEDARGALVLAIAFWNASVHASKLWEHPRVKELNELRKRMRGRQATREDAAIFDLLTACRRSHWTDPPLVDSWTYHTDDAARGASCARSDSPTASGPRFRRSREAHRHRREVSR